MNNVCKIDSSQIDEILNRLNEENRNKIMIDALKEGGNILQENTRQNLIKEIGISATSTNHHRKPMNEGVKLITDKDYLTVLVSIMGDYRLKWFEMGTRERYRKVRGVDSKGKKYVKKSEKGGYTGQITGTHFFKSAREDTAPIEEAIISAMESELNKLIKS